MHLLRGQMNRSATIIGDGDDRKTADLRSGDRSSSRCAGDHSDGTLCVTERRPLCTHRCIGASVDDPLRDTSLTRVSLELLDGQAVARRGIRSGVDNGRSQLLVHSPHLVDHGRNGLAVRGQSIHLVIGALLRDIRKQEVPDALPLDCSVHRSLQWWHLLKDRCASRARGRAKLSLECRRKIKLKRLTVTKSHTCAPIIARGRRLRRLDDWSAGRPIDAATTIAQVGLTVRFDRGTTTSAVAAAGAVTTTGITSTVVLATAATIATVVPMTR